LTDQAAGLLSPWLRQRRFAAALPHVRGTVLDVGCGIGMAAASIPAPRYLGVDTDEESLTEARRRFPRHRFVSAIPAGHRFDSVLALAVIEHVPDPAAFLTRLGQHLAPGGQIILTTPHPRGGGIHTVGAGLGLFSAAAADEHEELLDRAALARAAADAGLISAGYRRFLLGVNQLCIFRSPE
jgi:SAM-dependent methyltransferase